MRSIRRIYNHNKPQQVGDADQAGQGQNSSAKSRRSKARTNNSSGRSAFKHDEKLAAMIIHEIRNPLTAISLANQAAADELRERDLPAELHVANDIITKNINRIEELLKRLLDSTRGEPPRFVATDVCELLESCLGRVDDRIYLKKLTVNTSYNHGLLINADAARLAMAFLNIITNSIEAIPEGAGKLWITAYRLNDEVRVIFKDNGEGMEPHQASQMFDKNFSLKKRGLGVGLTHVKDVLQMHDASIAVSTEPGTGTLIVIVFKSAL